MLLTMSAALAMLMPSKSIEMTHDLRIFILSPLCLFPLPFVSTSTCVPCCPGQPGGRVTSVVGETDSDGEKRCYCGQPRVGHGEILT